MQGHGLEAHRAWVGQGRRSMLMDRPPWQTTQPRSNPTPLSPFEERPLERIDRGFNFCVTTFQLSQLSTICQESLNFGRICIKRERERERERGDIQRVGPSSGQCRDSDLSFHRIYRSRPQLSGPSRRERERERESVCVCVCTHCARLLSNSLKLALRSAEST